MSNYDIDDLEDFLDDKPKRSRTKIPNNKDVMDEFDDLMGGGSKKPEQKKLRTIPSVADASPVTSSVKKVEDDDDFLDNWGEAVVA